MRYNLSVTTEQPVIDPDSPAEPVAVGTSQTTRRTVAIGAGILVAVAGIGYASTLPLPGLDGKPPPPPSVGQRAPTFTLPAAGGGTIDLASYRGKPVVVNFWATWCTPCREELPELELAYRKHRDAGLVVIAVSLDTEAGAKDVPEFLKAGDVATGSYTFPVALDTKQDLRNRYRLIGVPSTYFVDRAGVIRAEQPGAMNREVLSNALETILTKAPGA
ncbi:MAG: TlpA family protein disulfide reductase [Chloroflexi bacterium]|nr:TlpA family protein disulfide reductase [Chloroflexota bacterium]